MVNRWLSLYKNNKVNSIGIFIIVLLTILLGTVFLETNQAMERSMALVSQGETQDFSYLLNITADDLAAAGYDYPTALANKNEVIAENYQIVWEERPFAMVRTAGGKEIFRIYQAERTMDRLYLTAGTLPAVGEMVVDEQYAKRHGLEVGDVFTVSGIDYTLSGRAVFPDQLYPLVDNTGLQYDPGSQAILALCEEDFAQWETAVNSPMAGRFSGGTAEENAKMLERMQEDENFFYVTGAQDNMQIGAAITSQQNMNLIIMGFSMGILGGIALLLVIITITQQIKTEQHNLGVLKAMGYTNIQISAKYLGYFFLILAAAVIGYLVGHLLTGSFYGLQVARFNLPFIKGPINYGNLLVMGVIPAAAITLLAFLTSIMKVRRPALHLIKDINIKKNGITVRRRNKKITDRNYLAGIRKIILFSNLLLFVFILFGGFALGVQIQFAYTTYNMTANISQSVMEGINYQSDVRFIDAVEDRSADNYYFYDRAGKLELADAKESKLYNLLIMGSGDRSLLQLYDSQGAIIDINEEDGLVINRHIALQNGLAIGDLVNFDSGGQVTGVPISNISQSVYGTTIYMGQRAAIERGILDAEEYNGMYSGEAVEFDANEHLAIVQADNLRESLDQSVGMFRVTSIILFMCGLVIGTTIILLSIFGVIANYRKYIAVMKIYGYSDRECSYAAIDGFRLVSMVGFLISIPYTFLLATIMFNIISAGSDMIYPVEFNIPSTLVCFGLTMIITEILIRATKRKITGISFREIMEH
ncbi:MAG: ABC transporter permease [Lachnospiraceae bacterium]|jgi:hypothetical protein|nr:ABC transporter permease [Lachnospiraceae bacterium]